MMGFYDLAAFLFGWKSAPAPPGTLPVLVGVVAAAQAFVTGVDERVPVDRGAAGQVFTWGVEVGEVVAR
jgi:hypothetical protein